MDKMGRSQGVQGERLPGRVRSPAWRAHELSGSGLPKGESSQCVGGRAPQAPCSARFLDTIMSM